ncbi:MAG: type IV toxin-antitoxin system AbiEi family antitoxin domain-containing protein [Deltaproteobacteria bacterium]|nr:type IV toxin-antitoxin system AbiEi family antitoxin domain-containing protein [Deltaproteobacteria bacterium]
MKKNVWMAVQELDRLVFSTREMAALTGSGPASVSQQLARLEEKGVVTRVLRGVWALTGDKRFSPFLLVPFLGPSQQFYVSFLSALHMHGMISQIPQTITVASTAHGRIIKTPVATFVIHKVEPGFFNGFEWTPWMKFPLATPEKALMDCLYISCRRGKKYTAFPELTYPKHFSQTRARHLCQTIGDKRLKAAILKKLNILLTRM